MGYKKLIPFIIAEGKDEDTVLSLALNYARHGADELFLYNYCKEEKVQTRFLKLVKKITSSIEIPVIIGCYVERFEDIKKALYTGAKQIVIKKALLENDSSIKEASKRFGQEKLLLEIEDVKEVLESDFYKYRKELGIGGIVLKHVTLSDVVNDKLSSLGCEILIRDSLLRNSLADLLRLEAVTGVSTNFYENQNLLQVKKEMKNLGISVNTLESLLSFEDFTCNENGLVPVVTQDYKSKEVLMVAYMNKEAYEQTVATGIMTYFSRSRKELWVKGETSGHYQYVKSLTIDCDNDTILAKIEQVGAACHTGHTSCFYTDLVTKEYDDINPFTVFQDVYDVILDRKKNPKEGSYTNYLFEKGIDKILKKCGEEATEIVIAAKNPDAEELKYEISDFLYHMMVLMVECDVTLEDITGELAHRR